MLQAFFFPPSNRRQKQREITLYKLRDKARPSGSSIRALGDNGEGPVRKRMAHHHRSSGPVSLRDDSVHSNAAMTATAALLKGEIKWSHLCQGLLKEPVGHLRDEPSAPPHWWNHDLLNWATQ